MTLEEAKVELEKFVKMKTTMRPAFVQPLLEAVEVKHGRWIINDNRNTCRCSCCENVELVDWALEQAKYCPHCGAKMDEVETDE